VVTSGGEELPSLSVISEAMEQSAGVEDERGVPRVEGETGLQLSGGVLDFARGGL
jgi:hypothetical protein